MGKEIRKKEIKEKRIREKRIREKRIREKRIREKGIREKENREKENRNKQMIRMTAGLLACVLVAGSILTGCGAKDGSGAVSDTAAMPASEAAAAETAVEAAADTAADGDMPMEMWTENGVAGSTWKDTGESQWYSGGNTEEYSEWEEKGFCSVYKGPLSTFSADVDTASYSNLRRMIQDGYGIKEIPEGAVRIEEIINYFSYRDLTEPEDGEPFGVTTRIMPCPWNSEAQLLRIGLKTEAVDYADLPDSNLVFLLDVSGSMYAQDKLPLLQDSFALLAENLTEKDCVSIVTYAGEDTVVIEGVRGNETKTICRALYDLEAGGSTYGSRGIETAYRLAEEYFIEGGNNRVILATDGDLNVGLTTEEELEELITEKKETGIFLSVLGFGTGNIKDNKMEILADKGNGNYAYIDSLREADKVLSEEMSATLLTVCKDVKFQVEFNPAVVEQYRLVGYDNRRLAAEDFDDDTKDAGEIGAGHCVTVLYEIITTEPVNGRGKTEKDLKYAEFYEGNEKTLADVGNRDAEPEGEGKHYQEYEWLTVSIRYKEPEGKESRLLEYPVDFADYTEDAEDDFLFAAAAAEFGLVVMDSAYKGEASLKHVAEVLKEVELDDEYKEEFEELVSMLLVTE